MRHAEPEFLIQWREWLKAGPPKCCHTCEHYANDGQCVAFFVRPLPEFADTLDECPEWEAECPF